MAQGNDVMAEEWFQRIAQDVYDPALDTDPMYDVLHPNVFSTTVSDINSMEFCKSHLDALNDADLVYTFNEPYVKVATEAEKDVYKYCKKCGKYCPAEMFARCKSGKSKAACIICTGDYGIIPSHIYENMRSVNNKINRRRAYYKTRLNSYTCEVCNETFTYNNIVSHNSSKKHNNALLQQDIANDTRDTKAKFYDLIFKQEAEIESLKSYIQSQEEHYERMEKMSKQRIEMLEDDLKYYKAKSARH